VPLSAGGKLTIVASSDLGGLGSKDGSPVIYNWVPPSLAPALLPWLAILALLALKPNRRAAAWLIWLPLGAVMALTRALPEILPSGSDYLPDAVAALAAGLAAVWLLSNKLPRPNRFVAFLCVLPVLAGFSGLALLSRQDWNFEVEMLQAGLVLALGVLASAAALSLGGLVCRGRYRPVGLYAWLILLVAVIWPAIGAPFFLVAEMQSGGSIAWGEFFAPVLAVAAVHFATLLPFLILSSASPFYRERLKALLHVKAEAPPVIAPLPEASLKT
jgi:hypothetical protein